ncbi:MAG: tetratricopeptide repeat protein [Candidatus Omnitrophica bacterium]|nr:tetratricopeptide repeat protein [Candidatus Omnitrophota bacterium]
MVRIMGMRWVHFLKIKKVGKQARFFLCIVLFSLIYGKAYCQDAEALFKSGTDFIKNGFFYEASLKLEDCLKINPEHLGCACNLGVAYACDGEYAKAIAILEKVAYKEEVPSRGVIFFNLGSMYGKFGNQQMEKEYYDKALSLLPYFSQAYGNLGSMYYMNNNSDKGLDCLMKANSMDSFMPDMQPNFDVVGTPGYMTVAVTNKSAFPLLYLYHSPAWYFTLLINDIEKNDLGMAVKDLNKAELALDRKSSLRSDKESFSQVHVYRANLILIKEGNLDKAFEEFLKGYEVNPKDLGAICGLSRIYLQRQDYDSALNYYRIGASINPDFAGLVTIRKELVDAGKLEQ